MSIFKTLMCERDDAVSRAAAAMLIKKSGLIGLVKDPTGSEIEALAIADEELAMERAVFLVWVMRNYSKASVPFDGGAALREDTKQAAYAMSRKSDG